MSEYRLPLAFPGLVNVGLSSLAPGTRITSPAGYTSEMLRCHLGLVAPANYAICVANETRAWSPGTCFVFDYTVEHKAWNRSDSTRIVFLLDFKRDVNAPLKSTTSSVIKDYDLVSPILKDRVE